ncbi:MAG: protein-glutamate O-methyltransferase CheR, partial [Actinobacteria bacterium]|nr:protein-glutamate O-methyltransferase CheR [Actinomycetota bacterium]
MTVDQATLAAAAAVLSRRAGLRSEESMRSRLERCLEEAAQRYSCSVDAFVDRLDRDSGALQALLDRLTVQESAFFRDPGQFEALASGVLPSLERPTVVWSAACANGQEPHSLAMLLDASGDTTSKVIASDISTTALERTRRGTYSGREVAGLTDEQRRRYLRRSGSDAYTVVDEIRERVEVLHLNLASDPPPFAPGECPVVFCRNVMIYFSNDQIVRLLERFDHWMAPEGVLFLGYSESLWQVTDRFVLERMGAAFVYRRRGRRRPDQAGSTTASSAAPQRSRSRSTSP